MKQENTFNLDNFWIPFTGNKAFKAEPRLLVEADGMYYTSDDDKKILDGIAGMWCCNAGHCHPHIVKAVQDQIATMDYATAFNMSHPKAFELAEKISQLTPEGLDRIFFGNSGSEAVDTALKVAVAYHVSRGEGQRSRFISREKGYHGVNVGGTSVGGIPTNRKSFGALLSGTDHLPHTWDPKEMSFSKGQPTWGLHLAEELESILTLQDASTIAGVIIEPVIGSGGVIVPPEGYLERIREICDKHGILLIFDEVITGFGRLGNSFAANRFNVCPDIITMAKGLTGAAIPMSATAFKTEIYDEIVNSSDSVIELFHGYTYSGHPVAAAAGLATLEVYENENLFNRALIMEPIFEENLHSLKGEKFIIDIRNLGLMGAIHFGSEDNRSAVEVASKVFKYCYENDVLVRFSGEFIVLSPALIVEEEQIKLIIETIRQGIHSLN
ncbi:MAG TPA: aspartate aminotransferase family protein [Gammaproteobacteria bacterium]|jgi:beta-alanine--pyruvate transaminase|nr:aspartate aminotransferase family protein [Gammaproteobacteria bacterium]HIB75689.1 aspartate aminotransferase family protein [Gammaproteobacteria bacterium]HIO04925.1 aspartate aminotransferase family protein [Gammaproteobacteria bacterium]